MGAIGRLSDKKSQFRQERSHRDAELFLRRKSVCGRTKRNERAVESKHHRADRCYPLHKYACNGNGHQYYACTHRRYPPWRRLGAILRQRSTNSGGQQEAETNQCTKVSVFHFFLPSLGSRSPLPSLPLAPEGDPN